MKRNMASHSLFKFTLDRHEIKVNQKLVDSFRIYCVSIKIKPRSLMFNPEKQQNEVNDLIEDNQVRRRLNDYVYIWIDS